MSFVMMYAIFYFKPEPHHCAFHTTHFWLWAKFILWLLKRKGYSEAYIDKNVTDLKLDCIKEYGWKFGEDYDRICQGIPIGNLEETVKFLEKVEYVKKLNRDDEDKEYQQHPKSKEKYEGKSNA